MGLFAEKLAEKGAELVIGGAVHVVGSGLSAGIDKLSDALNPTPSRDKLAEIARELSSGIGDVETALSVLDAEIAEARGSYEGCSILKVSERKRRKEKVRRKLMLKYGFGDFVSLLLDHLDSGEKMTLDEAYFFRSYWAFLSGKKVHASDEHYFEDLVDSRHGKSLDKLKDCRVDDALRRLRGFAAVHGGVVSPLRGVVPRR